MPRGKRSTDQTNISISLSRDLLAEIDDLAAGEDRARSNWIVRQLREIVALRKKKAETLTGLTAAISPHRLNEDPPPARPANTGGPKLRSTRGIKNITASRKDKS